MGHFFQLICVNTEIADNETENSIIYNGDFIKEINNCRVKYFLRATVKFIKGLLCLLRVFYFFYSFRYVLI